MGKWEAVIGRYLPMLAVLFVEEKKGEKERERGARRDLNR